MTKPTKVRSVLLFGHLGKAFGYEHRLAVRSVGEAIRALKANCKGFEQYLLEHNIPGYRVFVGDNSISTSEGKVAFDAYTGGSIKIVPVVAGASTKDVLDIFIGAVLVYYGGAVIAASLFQTYTGVYVATAVLTALGWALVTKGVGNLLFSPPKIPEVTEVTNLPSYAFNGPVNTIAQGNPVPICYGRLRVGSQVISAGLSVEQMT